MLKYVKNKHTLPAWATFPFSTDNPLQFLQNVTYINVDRGTPIWAYGSGAINLNPTYPNYKQFSGETLWVAQVAGLMKEATYDNWFKVVKGGSKGNDSYADWVTTWAFVFTLQDISDANGGEKWVMNGQKVGEGLTVLINDYTAMLNNEAAARGWK